MSTSYEAARRVALGLEREQTAQMGDDLWNISLGGGLGLAAEMPFQFFEKGFEPPDEQTAQKAVLMLYDEEYSADKKSAEERFALMIRTLEESDVAGLQGLLSDAPLAEWLSLIFLDGTQIREKLVPLLERVDMPCRETFYDEVDKALAHPETQKLLQTVLSVRADMIRSDTNLTSFEMRAPMGCSQKDYALLLADVLHCSNPSKTYGDTEELLSIAEKEIPGVMDMLYVCPLRLIDPVNRQSLGFYQFKPYAHAMWVQYVPPQNTGKVINRYHEVDDRTKPLSSGLQLTLFCDCWAVIPTLFHCPLDSRRGEHRQQRGGSNTEGDVQRVDGGRNSRRLG